MIAFAATPGRSHTKRKKVLLEFLGSALATWVFVCRMLDKRVRVDFAGGLYWVLAPW